MAESLAETTKELVFLRDDVGVFELEDLLSSSAETLGKGTFGYTYVVDLEGKDDVVAVKRLKVTCVSELEFVERVERLGMMVHENLLPIQAYCCRKNTRRLVYDFMPVGSLSSLLHESKGLDWTPLGWEDRTRIAYGVACGINYLHSQGPEVCHGNIRSSNVFLTDSGDARLSEYGIAQLVSAESHLTLAAGNHAPEVSYAHQVSPQADVYSFGVLLLELLTGLSATKSSSNKEGTDLPRWVRLMFQEKPILNVLDKELQKYQKDGRQMVLLLQLAICCTFKYPNKRPLMSVVTDQIKMICRF